MASIYVALIVKDIKKYSDVPSGIKPQVRQMLIDLELEHLINE